MSTQTTITPAPAQTPPRPAFESSAPPTPGSWRHPLNAEITRRQRASTFSEDNLRRSIYNGIALSFLLYLTFLSNALSTLLSHSILRLLTLPLLLALSTLLLYNLTTALLPLLKKPDDLTDLPLTPTQRALLGLSPSPKPNNSAKGTPDLTPGGTYITPPRYPLSATRSVSSSAGGSGQRSNSGSIFGGGVGVGTPTSRVGSGKGAGNAGTDRGDSPVHSPLWAKTREVQRRGSGSPLVGAGGRSGSLGRKDSGGRSSFGGGTGGGGGSGLLNSKWLYERGRDGGRGSPSGLSMGMGSRRGSGWDS